MAAILAGVLGSASSEDLTLVGSALVLLAPLSTCWVWSLRRVICLSSSCLSSSSGFGFGLAAAPLTTLVSGLGWLRSGSAGPATGVAGFNTWALVIIGGRLSSAWAGILALVLSGSTLSPGNSGWCSTGSLSLVCGGGGNLALAGGPL